MTGYSDYWFWFDDTQLKSALLHNVHLNDITPESSHKLHLLCFLIPNLYLLRSLGVFRWQALHPGCLQCGKHGVAWDRVRNAPRVLCNDVQTALQRIDPVQQVSESYVFILN